MSFGGTEKEFIYNLWLKTRKERFEQALGIRLGNIRLEQALEYPEDHLSSENSRKRKKPVDVYAVDTVLGAPVLVETLLARSNGAHQEAVQHLIDYLDAGTVVYQAFGYQGKHVRELRNMVVTSGKPIRLYIVEINQAVLQPIQELDRLNKLDVWDNLSLVDSVPHLLQVVERVDNPLFSSIQPRPIPDVTYDFSSRKDVNAFMIEELRRHIPQFLPFHREKTLYPQNPVVYFGGGASGLTYHCAVRDSRNYAFVDLRFSQDRSYLFNLFAMKPWLLQSQIDERVYVEDNRIGVQFRSSNDTKASVAELVKIFRAMIEHVSRPLYDLLDFEYEVMAMRKRRTA